MARVRAIREVRITEQTYYLWRKQYGGMCTDQLKKLKRLQNENQRLRNAVSDLTPEKLISKDATRGSDRRPGNMPVACFSPERAEHRASLVAGPASNWSAAR
jgi:hypothetical protein